MLLQLDREYLSPLPGGRFTELVGTVFRISLKRGALLKFVVEFWPTYKPKFVACMHWFPGPTNQNSFFVFRFCNLVTCLS